MKGGGTEPPSMSGRPSEAKGKLRLGWASSMKLAASRGAVAAQMPVWWVPALLGAHLTALSYFPPTRALLVNLLPCSLSTLETISSAGRGPRLSHLCCEAQGMAGQGRKGRKEGDGWMHRRGIRLGHVRGGQS